MIEDLSFWCKSLSLAMTCVQLFSWRDAVLFAQVGRPPWDTA